MMNYKRPRNPMSPTYSQCAVQPVRSGTGQAVAIGSWRIERVSLEQFRSGHRLQERIFEMSAALTRDYKAQPSCEAPPHVLFPQIVKIVERYVRDYVEVRDPNKLIDVFLAPYYGLIIERLLEAIRPDTSQGETPELPRYELNRAPGSTGDVDFWTSREPREVIHSHLNYIVPDTTRWEQSAAWHIDRHPQTAAFVKNAGLGFAIPYLHDGRPHDYIPDFIVRLKDPHHLNLILEVKGFDPVEEVKRNAAERWVAAVNADGSHGRWAYGIIRKPEEVTGCIDACRG